VRHVVILAGGSGTRLWPASRQKHPKQLLPLVGGKTLLGAAVKRGRMIGDVTIVTAESQRLATERLGLDTAIIAEPIGRNTAPAIGLAAAKLAERDPDAVLVILPADQHVADEQGLVRALELLCEHVERTDAIGTVGITVTRPETGFGYLHVGAAGGGVVPVQRFVEKPDRATAERYAASGEYLWNAGMFVASAKRLLAELDAHAPAIGSGVREIAAGRAKAADVYPTLPSISIDHAVMERATGVVTVPASVGWDDVGSWAALAAIAPAHGGNVVAGRAQAIALDGAHNIYYADDDTVIATVGLENYVVVKSGNAVLVLPRDRAQDVRQVVDALAARKLEEYL
jgi:mannose-1-phosphate guanylyltransferase